MPKLKKLWKQPVIFPRIVLITSKKKQKYSVHSNSKSYSNHLLSLSLYFQSILGLSHTTVWRCKADSYHPAESGIVKGDQTKEASTGIKRTNSVAHWSHRKRELLLGNSLTDTTTKWSLQRRPVRWDQSDMLYTFSDHQMKQVRPVLFQTTKWSQSDMYLFWLPNKTSQTHTFPDHQMKPVSHVSFQTTKWSQSGMYLFRPPNEASQTCCTFSDYQIKPVRHVPFQTTKWSQSDMKPVWHETSQPRCTFSDQFTSSGQSPFETEVAFDRQTSIWQHIWLVSLQWLSDWFRWTTYATLQMSHQFVQWLAQSLRYMYMFFRNRREKKKRLPTMVSSVKFLKKSSQTN